MKKIILKNMTNEPYDSMVEKYLEKYKKRSSLNSYRIMKHSLFLPINLFKNSRSKPCNIILSDKHLKKLKKKLMKRVSVDGKMGLSCNTIRTYFTCLLNLKRSIFPEFRKERKKNGDVQQNTPQIKTIIFDELELKKIKPMDIQLATILAYEEHLKPSEIVKLKWKNVTNNFVVCRKIRTERKIKCGPMLQEYLNKIQSYPKKGESYIFLSRKGEKSMKEYSLRQYSSNALAEIGADGMNLMKLRTLGINKYVKENREKDIIRLSEKLGYKGTQNIRRYMQKEYEVKKMPNLQTSVLKDDFKNFYLVSEMIQKHCPKNINMSKKMKDKNPALQSDVKLPNANEVCDDAAHNLPSIN